MMSSFSLFSDLCKLYSGNMEKTSRKQDVYGPSPEYVQSGMAREYCSWRIHMIIGKILLQGRENGRRKAKIRI